MIQNLTLDDLLQIQVAEKVAHDLGMDRFNYKLEPDGLLISMGRTNEKEKGGE